MELAINRGLINVEVIMYSMAHTVVGPDGLHPYPQVITMINVGISNAASQYMILGTIHRRKKGFI